VAAEKKVKAGREMAIARCPECGVKVFGPICPRCGKEVAALPSQATPIPKARQGMVFCRACHAEISAKTRKCPQCGEPRTPERTKIWMAIFIILGFLFVMGVWNSSYRQENSNNIGKINTYQEAYTNWAKAQATKDASLRSPFKVAWKTGIIIGLIVPSNTTEMQLKDMIYKFRKARKEKTLASMIPPINAGLIDKYANFIVFIFSDPKWATLEEYTKYERSDMNSKVSKIYLNHIAASYWYDFDGKEYGSIGHDEGGLKSAHYKKLF
jgi:rRNA maturation protein Nop10